VHQELHINFANNKILIVLLHAFPLNSQMWKYQFKNLTQSGYSVLTLDYPAFGLSGVWGKN
jgi:pimeloyl-ACP methyl ester carboxylesterase